jgi:hypothetical protein
MNNKTYDALKNLVQLWIPAAATLYLTLATIWGLPAAEAVVATSVAISTFLGVVLRISTKVYENSEGSNPKYDGLINIEAKDGKVVYNLDLNRDPRDLDEMQQALFKISPSSEPS